MCPLYTMNMEKDKKEKKAKTISDDFVLYDPENLPYMKLCVCDIIRELPELTPEDIARFKNK